MKATTSTPIPELLRHTLDFCTVCIERGDLPGAHQAMNRAYNLAPNEPGILSQRGRIALVRKQFDSAEADFTAALKLDDRCSMAHSGLARYYLEKGCLAEAEASARRALGFNPTEEDAIDVLSDARMQRVPAPLLHPARVTTSRGDQGMVAKPDNNRGRDSDDLLRKTNQTTPWATSSAPVVQRLTAQSVPLAPMFPTLPAAEASDNSRVAVAQFHADASDYFADVVPPPLSDLHLRHSRIVPSREQILTLMPKGGICAEVGTQAGAFAKLILSILHPSKLHIYDLSYTPFDHAYFRSAVQEGRVELHQGDSSTLLGQLPDRHFDFIYIDGDHSYDGVVKDLEQAARKIKDDGWIVCNDYAVYSPLEKIKYGVCRAVNELCVNQGFEVVYLGLHPWGYHDIALKRRAPTRLGGASLQEQDQCPVPTVPLSHRNGKDCDKGTEQIPVLVGDAPEPPLVRVADEARLRQLARYVGEDWKQHAYYDEAEQYMSKQWSETVWPFIREADFECVLDLAAGHGRNSERLKEHARKIYLVDINQENIDYCRQRFAGDPRFEFFRNDGCSLAPIPSGTLSLVYCFDAMVHFDSDIVRAYLREFCRVLRPGGLGFCHHSNYSRNPGGDVHQNPGWRNFMSQQLFAHYCAKEGLTMVRFKLVDWTGPESDCVTLFRRP